MSEKNTDKQYILLIEDDDELAALIKEYLESVELKIEIETQGQNAAQRVINEQPDLVILDLMLPGKDGISICREIRPSYNGPILMLTASNESVDQIVGLEIGADDYVQKPIEPRILLARIRALLRRLDNKPISGKTTINSSTDCIDIANISLNPATRQVKVAGNAINLSTPEYDVLQLLMQNCGNILSRDDVFKTLRGIEYDGQNRLVDITVSQVRSKLSLDGISDKHIKTVRNKGYMFVETFD